MSPHIVLTKQSRLKHISFVKTINSLFYNKIFYYVIGIMPVIVLRGINNNITNKLFLELVNFFKIDSNIKSDYLVDIVGINNLSKVATKDYIPVNWRLWAFDNIKSPSQLQVERVTVANDHDVLKNYSYMWYFPFLYDRINLSNEINYIFRSTRFNTDICIKILLPETTSWISISKLFQGAFWAEREVWDLCGIPFKQHNDLRRILTDYGFIGHPLKKDFPISGYVELRYDENKKRLVTEPVTVTQDFRVFEYTYTWSAKKI